MTSVISGSLHRMRSGFSPCMDSSPLLSAGHRTLGPTTGRMPTCRQSDMPARPGFGSARPRRFSRDEQRTLLTLWSIICLPLMLGCDLPRNDEWTTSLLTNAEVIAVDQHARHNRPLLTTDVLVIWSATPEDGKGHLPGALQSLRK